MTETETTETKTEAVPFHIFESGDTFTTVRGRLAGRTGTVLKRNAGAGTYAVEMSDGTLCVLKDGNLKPPAESVIGARALGDVIAGLADDLGPDALSALVVALSAVIPGVADRVYALLPDGPENA